MPHLGWCMLRLIQKGFLAVAALSLSFGAARAAGESVFIIAEIVSTSMEARRIASEQQWQIAPLRRAQYALVVVRSELESPLLGTYRSIHELQRDAANQLNIAGSNYVVYIYALDDDLRPSEVKKLAYPARD